MSTVNTRPFDPTKYLDTSEAIVAYMTEARKTGDLAFVADALDVVARARNMNKLTSE